MLLYESGFDILVNNLFSHVISTTPFSSRFAADQRFQHPQRLLKCDKWPQLAYSRNAHPRRSRSSKMIVYRLFLWASEPDTQGLCQQCDLSPHYTQNTLIAIASAPNLVFCDCHQLFNAFNCPMYLNT